MAGGRPKGSRNKITRELKEMILAALDAKGGKKYLEQVAEKDPRTFCALLGRVLPMTVVGDINQTVRFEVTLAFRDPRDAANLQSEDGVQARVPGSPANGKALVHMRSS